MSDRESRDVVVIGAGLGGLAAAAYLARRGLSVLVVERHDEPGGYASPFTRARFSFEVSLHLIDAMGPGQPHRALLRELGVGDELRFVRPPSLRREIWPEHDLCVPHGLAAYLALLGAHFPEDRAGLAELAELARSAHAEATSPGAGGSLPDALDATSLVVLGSLGRRTAAELIAPRVRSARLYAILDLFAQSSLGVPLDDLPAVAFLVPWYSYHAHGGAYPEGGSAALARALVRAIEAQGGEVRLATPARRIAVKRRRAQGVELAGGRAVDARAVVSNLSPQQTFGELVDPAEVEPSYLARIEQLAPSVSCLKVWLGLSSAPRSPVVRPGDHDVRLCPSYEVSAQARFDPRAAPLSVLLPSHLDQARAPEGGSVVSISMLMDAGAYAAAEAAEPAFRSLAAGALVDRVEAALFPGLRALIEVMEVATPSTFERFTGNPGGSIYGAHAQREPAGSARVSTATPIDGLYLAGAWTQPGGGFSAALRSGKRAGERILATARRGGRP